MTDILNADQAAELLDCDKSTIEELARTGKLPAKKFGRGWVFVRDLLIEAVKLMCIEESAQRKEPKVKHCAIAHGKQATRQKIRGLGSLSQESVSKILAAQ